MARYLLAGTPMDVIRRAGGFREYANQVIMGPIIVGEDDMEPVYGTKVTLIGHPEKLGHLTGRTRKGHRCDMWQCYWTHNPTGADNTYQWVPRDQIIRRKPE